MAESNNTAVSTEKMTALLASKATEWIATSIAEGKMKVPEGYDVGSEMFSAMLAIAQTRDKNGRPALQVCTQESILSELKDMATLGISMAKKQCYPIVMGDSLHIMRSYFGSQCVFSYLYPDYKATADVIYEGDEYILEHDDIYEFDNIRITARKLENRDKPIVAAYGVITDMRTKERVGGCVMTIKEIKASWSHAKTQNVHREFPQEMAKRTVMNRMLKNWINASPSNGNTSMVEAYRRNTENEFDNGEQLVDVTPTDTAKMLREKSRGTEGLSALLASKKPTVAKVIDPEPVKAEEAPNTNGEPIIERKDNPKTEQKKINDMPVPEETIDMSTGEIISQPVGPEGFSDEELPF